jgi:hypothetical protein
MSLIGFLFLVLAMVLLIWVVRSLELPQQIKSIFYVFAFVLCLLLMLQIFGLLPGLESMRIGR